MLVQGALCSNCGIGRSWTGERHDMVICMVTNMIPTRDDPGFGVFIKSQIDSIAAAGHEVTTLAIDGRASKKNYSHAVRELNRILAAKKHDIVHAHYGLSGIPACVQRHCPVVVSFCGDDLLGTSNGKGDYTFKAVLRFWQASSWRTTRTR